MSAGFGPIGDARVEIHVDLSKLQNELKAAERVSAQATERIEANLRRIQQAASVDPVADSLRRKLGDLQSRLALSPHNTQLRRELESVRKQLDALDRPAARATRSVGGLAAALRSLRVVGPIAAIGATLSAMAREAGKAEQEFAKIHGVIRATGHAAGYTAERMVRLTREIALETGRSSSEINSVAAQLLTFWGIAGANFEDALRISVDMGVVFGSTAAAASQLGKALEDPIEGVTALRRVGTKFTEAQMRQIEELVNSNRLYEAQRIVLNELQRQVGGVAKEVGDTLPGAWDRLKESMSDALARAGEWLRINEPLKVAVRGLAAAVQASADFLFPSPQEQLEQLDASIAQIDSTMERMRARGVPEESDAFRSIQRDLDALLRQRREVWERIERQQREGFEADAAARGTQIRIAAENEGERLDALAEKYQTSTHRAKEFAQAVREIAELSAKRGLGRDEQARLIQEAQERIFGKPDKPKGAENQLERTISRIREALGELRFDAAGAALPAAAQQAMRPVLDAIRDFQQRNAQLADLAKERAEALHKSGMSMADAMRQANAETIDGFKLSSDLLRADLERIGQDEITRRTEQVTGLVRSVLQAEASITQDREAQTRARIQLIEMETEAQKQAILELRALIEASYLPPEERERLIADLDALIERLEVLKEQQKAEVSREGTLIGQLSKELEEFPTMAEFAMRAIDNFADTAVDALIAWASGAESAEEAFSRFAQSLLKEAAAMILKLLILRALMAAIGAIGGDVGGGGGGLFAPNASAVNFPAGTTIPVAHEGGRVLAGRMALVGGPGAEELFVPASGGRIIPPDVLRALGVAREQEGQRIVVNNFSPERVDVKPGRRETEIVIGRAVAADLRRGGESARALEQRGVRFTPRGR